MIERFSKEELEQIIQELNEIGMKVKVNYKGRVLSEEAGNVFGGSPYISTDIRKSILRIADLMTNNFEYPKPGEPVKTTRTYARSTVPDEIAKEYRKIISGIFEVMKPHYGMLGFRDKNDQRSTKNDTHIDIHIQELDEIDPFEPLTLDEES